MLNYMIASHHFNFEFSSYSINVTVDTWRVLIVLKYDSSTTVVLKVKIIILSTQLSHYFNRQSGLHT